MSPEEFKQWRNLVQLTQVVAGEVLGVSRITIQNWESGAVKIPVAVEAACELHVRRWKMRSEFGPVTLTYFDSPLWQPTYGPIAIPKVSRELYPTNAAALDRVCELSGTSGVHNLLIVAESGEVLWNSVQLEQERERRRTRKGRSSARASKAT